MYCGRNHAVVFVLFVRASVCASLNIVNMLSCIWHIFNKLTLAMHYGTKMNAS